MGYIFDTNAVVQLGNQIQDLQFLGANIFQHNGSFRENQFGKSIGFQQIESHLENLYGIQFSENSIWNSIFGKFYMEFNFWKILHGIQFLGLGV